VTSIVDIVNMALDTIKARATVTSIFPSDGSLAANVASRNWWTRIDGLARTANWNSHRFQQTLALLKAAQGTPENVNGTVLPIPPVPWFYEYALPTNPLYLRARFILPVLPNGLTGTIPLTTAGGAYLLPGMIGGRVPYQVSGDLDANGNQVRVLLCNLTQAQLVFTARVLDPNLWDPQFVEAAIGVMGSYLCNPVQGDMQQNGVAIARAKEAILAARVSDGLENPVRSDHIPDWITARGVMGAGSNNTYAMSNGWEAFAFGDGSFI
jgi:hypothetical protein